MNKNLIFYLVLSLASCSCVSTNSIIGTWETGIIDSEWGPNKIVVTYFEDGTVEGSNHFRSDGNSEILKWQGTYKIKRNTLSRTVDGHKVEIKYDISDDIMKQYIDGEVYKFKKR